MTDLLHQANNILNVLAPWHDPSAMWPMPEESCCILVIAASAAPVALPVVQHPSSMRPVRIAISFRCSPARVLVALYITTMRTFSFDLKTYGEKIELSNTNLRKSINKLVATVGSNSDMFTGSRLLYNFFKYWTFDFTPGTLYRPSTFIPCSST